MDVLGVQAAEVRSLIDSRFGVEMEEDDAGRLGKLVERRPGRKATAEAH